MLTTRGLAQSLMHRAVLSSSTENAFSSKRYLFAQSADVSFVVVSEHLISKDGICYLGRSSCKIDL